MNVNFCVTDSTDSDTDRHMFMDDDHNYLCHCGRSFPGPGPLNFHKRTCQSSKRRLQGALTRAKELWEMRKKPRLDAKTAYDEPNHGLDTLAEKSIFPPEIQTTTTPELFPGDENLPIAQRRPRRLHRQLPKRFRDIIPQPPPPLPPSATLLASPSPPSPPASSSLRARVVQFFTTPRNIFGLARRYHSTDRPSHDPEELATIHDLSESDPPKDTNSSPASGDARSFLPYPNQNSFRLGEWYWNHGVQKSQESFKELLSIVGDPDFTPDDIRKTKWSDINSDLGANDFDERQDQSDWLDEDAGWRRKAISISVPFHNRMKNPGPKTQLVGELYHRSLVSVIKEKLANQSDNERFHYEPYELLWKPNEWSDEVHVQGEFYTSAAFRDAHRDLQASPGEPDCGLPRIVVALMFSSDVTHLTSFGTAKLWPCYLFFGNESKYRRCKPSCNLCNHVAYFQSLSDEFKDFAAKHTGGKGPNGAFMAHCHREVFHKQWEALLDDEFIEAYKHGIVVQCCDGITRRFYPRIFTYSADYPEKILLASIRNRGGCPCPRCLIPKSRMAKLGMKRDMKERTSLARVDDDCRRQKVATARRIIYDQNYAVNSHAVEKILKEQSLVPTSNAFSSRLAELGFNVFQMLAVDLMHEFELGVWKALFAHLLRIITAADAALVNELDHRYRQIPTFGRDTIRKFASNSSEMKKMTASKFEDLLQCAIPVFDGLLPEPYNQVILQLLFVCAHWHGLAKLRMHTDLTLKILDEVTVSLGRQFRTFAGGTCSAFDTYELKREAAARKRRQSKNGNAAAPTVNRQQKKFNLETYKYHSLGDYTAMIRKYGTCDSYTTATGEQAHRAPKARFPRTDRRQFVRQMAQIERRQARIRRIRAKNFSNNKLHVEEVATSPEAHHHIGKSENNPENTVLFVQRNSGDPAVKDFIPKLKRHLLPRVKSLLDAENECFETSPSATPDINAKDDWHSVIFQRDRIYKHNIMRINYTTYDVRRNEDVIHPGTSHRNVMVLNPEASPEHPFWYAQVLGIYHVNVVYIGEGNVDYLPRRLEFLWVRWYEMDDFHAGWTNKCLDRVRFPPVMHEDSFGFIDPSDILRGCHLMPAFSQGKVHSDGVGISHCAGDSGDWKAYYVGRFVDGDMMMRYHWGLAVGHVYAHRKTVSSPGAEDSDFEENPRELCGDEENMSSADLINTAAEGNGSPHSDCETQSDNSDVDSDDEVLEFDLEDGDDEDSDGMDDEELLAMEEMYGCN